MSQNDTVLLNLDEYILRLANSTYSVYSTSIELFPYINKISNKIYNVEGKFVNKNIYKKRLRIFVHSMNGLHTTNL